MTITLATLSQATAQEVFDQVAAHMLAQGQRSAANGIGCLYRNDDGLKCAAGCLIGDDEYKPEMEGYDWHCVVRDFGAASSHFRLIRELQLIHDAYEPETWRHKLEQVANKFGLESRL